MPEYSETLQTKLSRTLRKNETYCFKIKVRLSENSGFSINRLGVLFSKEAKSFENTSPLDSASISFTKPLNNQKDWETLCVTYTAKGDERYLSIGRFAANSSLITQTHSPKYKSPLNVNESAYYLMDDVALSLVSDHMECLCENPVEDVEKFTIGEPIILKNILFAFDRYELDPSSFSEIGELATYLQNRPQLNIEITGHTDDVGSDEYNLLLSQQRADKVRNWLIKNGISPDRVSAKGVGNKYPIDLESANSQINRRVEIVLTPN